MSLDLLLVAMLLFAGGGLAYFMVRARSRREAADTRALAKAHQEGLTEARTLHPVIDPDKCIGSLSCTAVCPEGNILGVVDGKAALINPSACIGHGKCALECPVEAISLVFGSARRGIDLPETDEFFQSSRQGVYIVGELGGMGLIKNAITQGLQVARHLGQKLEGQPSHIDDVVVVGAGPAGLATALGLRERGLRFRVLEQESLGGTIAHYPRQKVVMTERIHLPFFGKFGAPLISKEQLLENWQRAIAKAKVEIDTGVKVEGIEGYDGDFTVRTTRGPVRARKVVLAIGRRGTPRKLGVPGEDLPKVTYRLIDPQQYEGTRVLVVGGGDAAVEAAMQIAQESSAQVTLSCRQDEPAQAREANKRRFRELVAQGKLSALLTSIVKEVTDKSVTLEKEGQQVDLPNDYVIACLGGELPAAFLKKVDVGMTRLHGEALGPLSTRREALEKQQRRLAFGLFTLGAVMVATLFVVGWDYYRLPQAERLAHAAHKILKPAGPWGHGIGIVSTLVMLSNFLYALRKRWGRLKGFSTIRTWLTFHQFVGFMSPLVIAFHAAFQSKNQLATLTAGSLSVVVLTGIMGRFIYGLVPGGEGKAVELGELERRWRRLSDRLREMTRAKELLALVDSALVQPADVSLKKYFLHLPRQRLSDARQLLHSRQHFEDQAHAREFADSFKRLRRMQGQVSFFAALKRLLSIWRVFHVVLAVLLVILIGAHIGVSLFLGYRWILT